MRHRCGLVALVVCGWWSAASAGAEDSTAQELIQQAYQKTRGATSVEDFGNVVALCEAAESEPLEDAHAAYVQQLKSWAFNKRGEAFSDLAAAALEGGNADAAAQLDTAALADFERAVALAPERWKPLQNRAVSYAVAGRFDDAVADFSRVIELRPEHANAWFNRAELRYEQGRYDDAVVDYTESLARAPDDFGALTGRGHANFQAGRFAEALDDYHAAVRLASEDADAFANRGDAFLRLGNWEEAARDYRRAMRLDPDSPRAFRSAAWLMATCPDARYRDAELAVQAAEKAFDHATGSLEPTAFDTLAAAYANAGQYQKAQQTLARGIEMASAEQRAELQRRLDLYVSGQPYREPVGAATVRTASANVSR